MKFVLSWDGFLKILGNIEEELSFISILSASSDMGPPVVRKSNKNLEVEIVEEEELQFYPTPMYGDSVCTFGQGDSMTWYQIY